jgi:hypothetical protein
MAGVQLTVVEVNVSSLVNHAVLQCLIDDGLEPIFQRIIINNEPTLQIL